VVSVIIPNYNHVSFLKSRIDSVLNQTYQDFEIIILDDCSTDKSRNLIEGYRTNPKISHIVFNNVNSGSTFNQWEKGIKLAKGKFIWIAESDDYCQPSFLEVAIKKIKENKADVFVAKSVRIDENDEYLDEFNWWYEDLDNRRWKGDFTNNTAAEIKNYLSKKCTIINASAVVFENKAEIFGYLSHLKSFKSCGDWLFWLMYLNGSNIITYSTATVNYFRYHQNTTRAFIPFARNFEVLRIYNWVCRNVLNRNESMTLLNYYFSVHLSFHSRKKIMQNVRFVFQSFKYTSYTFLFLLKYYWRVKLFEGASK
jgi:glycosyltransferase involved in cell wall biosynthesis